MILNASISVSWLYYKDHGIDLVGDGNVTSGVVTIDYSGGNNSIAIVAVGDEWKSILHWNFAN